MNAHSCRGRRSRRAAVLAVSVAGLSLAGLLPAQAPERTAPSVATPEPAFELALPEAVEATQLQRWLLDQPATYAVLDLRPSWQFAEWHIAGASNVALADLATTLAGLPAATRVVLVDRDGTTAFAVAGAVMAHAPQRVLRVLVGGAQRYYRDIELAAATTPAAGAAPSAGRAPAAATPAPAAKKRSAGC